MQYRNARNLPGRGLALLVLWMALAACARQIPEDYNATGSNGSLVRQEVSFDSNVCYYSNGLTLYTQGSCPAQVRSNVYRR